MDESSEDAALMERAHATGTSGRRVMASAGGWAMLSGDGRSYKAQGDVSDVLWWTIGNTRFEAGELDGYVPDLRRLGDDEPIF
jgi:hypothetical protein